MLDVPPHPEIGTVDLQRDPRLGDRLVLVAHGLRDRLEIGLLARIVLVPEEERHDTRRRRRHERALGPDLRKRRLQVLDVGHHRLRVADRDRRVARGRLAPRSSRIAEHPLRQAREIREVLVDERVALAAESAQSILDVRRVTRLAHLAVVDHVDARFGLLLHDLLDRRRHALRECGSVDRHALLLREHRPDQVLGPRQAPGVGGQKSFGASMHRVSPGGGSGASERFYKVRAARQRPRRDRPGVCAARAAAPPARRRRRCAPARARRRASRCRAPSPRSARRAARPHPRC